MFSTTMKVSVEGLKNPNFALSILLINIYEFDQFDFLNSQGLNNFYYPHRLLITLIIFYNRFPMYLQNQDQINEAKEKYLQSLNRVNLLLVRQHDLRKDEDLYLKQKSEVQKQIERIKSGKDDSIAIFAQDQHLRKIIKKNQAQIIEKEKMMKGNETIQEIKEVKAIQQKYLKMMSSQFQSNIQQKLSMIRGKVDELKKKIKQLNKQILSYEQQHLEEIDDYSLNLQNLETYKAENQKLRQQIEELRRQQ